MYRRASDYFRNRSSISVVNETLGAPYKWVSFVLASFYLVFGVRDIFFCGVPFTRHDLEVKFVAIFKDCATDVYQEGFSGLAGLSHIIVGLVRLNVALTEHTAELYKSMMLLCFIDCMHVFLITRSPPIVVPLVYVITVVIGTVYEFYILYLSRRAYLSRQKTKAKVKEKER